MKHEIVLTLSAAVLSVAFLATSNAHAKSPKNASNPPVAANLQADAARMVAAKADVTKPIDAEKIQAGQQIQFTLFEKVKLMNGPELPKGTRLVGTASAGEAQAGGTSKLILHLTEAKLKDGKSIPIKATILGYYPTKSLEWYDSSLWNPESLEVRQSSSGSNLDLRSNILDDDSGVFVSAKGNGVKLDQGNWIAVAIEAVPDGQAASNNGN